MGPASTKPKQHFVAALPSMAVDLAAARDKEKQKKYENALWKQASFHSTLTRLHGQVSGFMHRLTSFQRQLGSLQGSTFVAHSRLDNFQSSIKSMHAQVFDVARHLVELEASVVDASQDLLVLADFPLQVARIEALLAALDTRAANLAVGFAEIQAA
jgi:hypothetical protein